MALAAQQPLTALREGFGRLSNGQKLSLIMGLAAAIALSVGLWIWAQTPDYRVLYGNLSDRDGGMVIDALQRLNVPYKVGEGGVVLVPASQVYDLRLRLASQGLPKGGTVGFELLDNQKFGTSQFQEQVNYQRALEGELARSIQSLAAVESARVHLAIPRPTVFVRDQQAPTASVLLSLYPGRVLDQGQISGVVHLVASSVPGLTAKNVTVVDDAGNLLSPQQGTEGRSGLDPNQLDYIRAVERSYTKRIEAIISPITGADNVRTQVTADLDFSRTEQTAEIFKPNSAPADQAIRSQQSSETVGGGGQGASGVPGALSNQPPGAATAPVTAPATAAPQGGQAAAGSGNMHKESTINYEVDKTIRHTTMPVGSIKRLSVAVVVNFKKQTDKAGKVTYKPLSAEELGQINNLVKEAMGFNAQRGDTLNVVNASFSPEERPAVPPLPIWKDPENIALAKELLKNLLVAGIILYLVFGLIRPMLRDLTRKPESDALAGSEPGVSGMEGRPGMEAAAEARGGAHMAGFDENLNTAKELAKQDPRIVANVVKEWVAGE